MENNFFMIRKSGMYGFTFVEASVSEEDPDFTVTEESPAYPTLTDALVAASRRNPDHGIVIHKECFV